MTLNYNIYKPGSNKTFRIVSLTFLIFTLLSCNSDDSTPAKVVVISQKPSQTSLTSLRLQQPGSCDDFKQYVVKSIINRHTSIPNYVYCAGTTDVNGPPVAAAPATDKNIPDDVSGTNNQEAGVNEGDIVKVDDRGNVYIASGRHLVISQGFPPLNVKVLKEINLDGHVTDLFLDKLNNRVIVISRFETPYNISPAKPVSAAFAPAPVQGSTDILILDVTTPETPIILKQTRLKGFFQTGRRIKDRLHLIMRNYINYNTLLNTKFWDLSNQYSQTVQKYVCDTGEKDPDVIATNPEIAAIKTKLVSNITTTFKTVAMEDYLPTAQQSDGKTKLATIPFLACSDIQHPKINSNLNLQYITSLDTNGNNMSATAMINNSWQTYVSKDNIYVSETSQHWWWDPQTNSIPTSQTAIYKFAISKQKPVYTATGAVDGYIQNQFSFSEFNGDLRVATTQDDWITETNDKGDIIRRRNLTNNLFVLRDNGSQTLETIGEVRGFGKDENIRSSRFMGDRAFVVTFRNVDPLFTFDLSVPEAPNLMGELTIPGFSSYMHPYDENHLVTIGRAPGAGGVGVGSGIQLQLFDVTDLANPALLHTLAPIVPGGWSWSSAEYDHKAFTLYKDKTTTNNILAIPIQYYSSQTSTGFSGIYVFNVDITNGFTLLGKVDHADLANTYYCNTKPTDPVNDQFGCVDGSYVRWAAPRRSIVMTKNPDVYLYTISDVGMKAANVNDLSNTLGEILFPEQPYPWYTIGGGLIQ